MEHVDFRELQAQIRRGFKDGEQQLVLFRRQYLQRLHMKYIDWPEPRLLRIYDVQRWLFFLIEESVQRRPYPQHDKSVLKELAQRIEHAVADIEEPVCFR